MFPTSASGTAREMVVLPDTPSTTESLPSAFKEVREELKGKTMRDREIKGREGK